MTITTTIPTESVPAWQAAVDKYNAGSGQAAVSIEQFAQILRDEETARYVAAKDADDRAAMAANSRLMALGAAVMAQPEKLDAIEAAVLPILES